MTSPPWTSGGVTWQVITDCAGYDTRAACETAHQEAVAFWQGEFPPDP